MPSWCVTPTLGLPFNSSHDVDGSEVKAMFVTITPNTAPMASASRAPNRSGTPDPVSVRANPPTQALTPSHSGSETLNLSRQIKEQMEQDLDYQILRRAFALDVDESTRLDSASESVPIDSVETASIPVSDPFDPPSIPSGVSAESFELQVSAQRLELSIRGGEASVMTSMANGNAQRLELNLNAAEGVQVQTADPLVLDLGGLGITTTGVAAGVDFDLNADGRLERMSTVSGDSWFLALDWNANGRIDDGRELFGDQNGAEHGFAELARHDDTGDARLDAQDAVFARLRLVQLQSDGSQTSRTLEEAGVTAIELEHQNVQKAIDAYDHVAQSGRFIRRDGGEGEAADVMLGYRDQA